MTSQVGVQRVGFTVTENRRLHKTKLHAGGCGESPFYLSRADCMFTSHRSTVQYYSAISVHSLVELITLSRIMNELCSKVVEGEISFGGYYREITSATSIHKYWSEG